jgi:Wiskott-Aldrich syndrome protein
MSRNQWLYAALAATLLATAWLALEPDAQTEPAVAVSADARGQRRGAASPAADSAARTPSMAVPSARISVAQVPGPAPTPPVEAKARNPWAPLAADALAAWTPPAPPAPPPKPAAVVAEAAPPPKPPPPTFPYKWIGQITDAAGPLALLDSPQRSTGARAGDVLDGRWRIDKVSDAQIELTWLPTHEPVIVRSP